MMDVRDGFVGNMVVEDGRLVEAGRDAPGKVIVALPAYNEEKYIARVILGCRGLVDEVVVVDDGSDDATADIAEALGAIVVRHDGNRGYGAAIRTCFEAARERGAECMVILDSDGQHDPGDIPKMIELIGNGADIVIGSRFISNGNRVPLYRRIGMKVLDFATGLAGGVKTSDSQSGFRAYSRRAVEGIKLNGTNMSAGSEILLQAKELGLKIAEVPITCRYDQGKSSQNPLSHGLSVLTAIFGKLIYKRPLLYFLSAGTMFLAAGSGTGIYTLHSYLNTGNLPFGPTIAVLLLLILGSLSVFSGIILHTITKILKEIQKQ